MPESDVLDQVLVSFAQARAAIKATFGVGSAPEIVAAVLHGERSRNGVCNNGWEYYVHGVDYTVVLPSGGQVHLDGSEQGDFFTAYDVSFFLETEEGLDKIDAVTVKAWCETMCERNLLCRAGESKYSLP